MNGKGSIFWCRLENPVAHRSIFIFLVVIRVLVVIGTDNHSINSRGETDVDTRWLLFNHLKRIRVSPELWRGVRLPTNEDRFL